MTQVGSRGRSRAGSERGGKEKPYSEEVQERGMRGKRGGRLKAEGRTGGRGEISGQRDAQREG